MPALAAIHQAGLIHRDVKAHNVMIDEHGGVVLMDFGAGSDASLGDDSRHEGTPLYMAPEVLAGGAARPESDLYSVGVLLYHLVTGAYPVGGRSLEQIGNPIHRVVRRATCAFISPRRSAVWWLVPWN